MLQNCPQGRIYVFILTPIVSVGGFLFESAFVSWIYFCGVMTEYKLNGVRGDLKRKRNSQEKLGPFCDPP